MRFDEAHGALFIGKPSGKHEPVFHGSCGHNEIFVLRRFYRGDGRTAVGYETNGIFNVFNDKSDYDYNKN